MTTSTNSVRARRSIRAFGAAALIGIGVATVGCATPPPPREFDLRSLQVVVVEQPVKVDISGLPGGKATGAGVGAGTGSGAGVLIGATACLATGLFFPLCVLAVVPTSAAVGAVAGGVVGAVRTESVEDMASKTQAVRTYLLAGAYPKALGDHMTEELRLATRSAAEGQEAAAQPPWTIEVAVIEVGTEGKREFALRLVASATLRRVGQPAEVWTSRKEVQSESELTTAAWVAGDGRAMQLVLDRCIRQAAHELVVDLTRPVAAAGTRAHPRSRYSSSCHDEPEAAQASASAAMF